MLVGEMIQQVITDVSLLKLNAATEIIYNNFVIQSID